MGCGALDTKKNAYAENAVTAGEMENESAFHFNANREESLMKPALLLHSCCGPCSTAVIERLVRTYKITVFFYNPNISDRAEYGRRRDAQNDFIEQYNRNVNAPDTLLFMEGAYEPGLFEKAVRGKESLPEGGARCDVCFRLRLEKTAETAVLAGFDFFATTLSVSPHKNYETIARIGMELGLRYRICFLAEDFKKQDGFRRSVELSKQYGLYRQTGCGCRFAP